jgi:hypothetical protein
MEAGAEGQEGAPAPVGEGGDAMDESAAAHPSPIVAASYGGRGYRARGRGRGRGRGFYRAQVASMIASKSWVRKKDDGGGGGNEGGEGGADAPES